MVLNICGDERPQVLSADSVKSLVTINPALQNPKSTTAVPSNNDFVQRTRQNCLRDGSIFQHSTSVAACSMSSNIDGDDETTTLIATCNARLTGRIHLATIVEGAETGNGKYTPRSVTMKYSSKSDASSNRSFAAVCIANYQDCLLNQSSAAILAIDDEGKLYAHRIRNNESTESDSNKHLFNMDLCDNNVDDDTKHRSPKSKKGRNSRATQSSSSCQSFASMNTLTPRTEYVTAKSKTVPTLDEGLQESPRSTPKRNGRKRKATTPSSGKDEGAVYAIASCLNESHVLPSQSPPVIIRTSFRESGEHSAVREVSRSKITGLEHVDSPMTCILFASRASCGGHLWKTLASLIGSRKDEENVKSGIGTNDEGIVVMGFQDGSLYAALVVHGEAAHTSKILQLKSGEPILSLYILRTELSDSKLVTVGMLGTLTIIDSDENGDTTVCKKRLPFQGRFCSLAFIESHKSTSNEIGISMIGTKDTGKTYLFQLSMKCGESVERNADYRLQLEKVFRVPISGGCVSSIPTQQSKFLWSCQSGKVSLTRIAPGLKGKREKRSQSILATLRQNRSSRCNITLKHMVNESNATSKYEAVTKTLTAAIYSKSNERCTHSSHTSLSQQSRPAAKEIREAIRIVSLSSTSSPPPIECAINTSKSLKSFDLDVKSEKSEASSSWNHSIHTMLSTKMRAESIKDMTPLCYRRNRHDLRKVFYGGSSSSLNCQTNSSIHVPMYDPAPVSIYATLSKTYVQNENTDDGSWEESMVLNERCMTTVSGRAKRSSLQGAIVPFKLGQKSSIPLAGDVFAPLLLFANIVRIDGDAGNVRNAAEKEVQRFMQAGCVGKSLPITMMGTRHYKAHCCSNSEFLASSKKIDEFHKQVFLGNRERNFVPIALVYNSQKDTDMCELGFAFGSISNNSNEIMSLIPLMRHSIIRCAQQEEDLQLKVLKDECYSRLLSEKRAVKIARHVDKAARELLSRMEKPNGDACSAAQLTKCISLYEIMRTLQFIIG